MNATVSRRQFIKTSALLGGCAAWMSRIEWALSRAEAAETTGNANELLALENQLRTVCLQCNTGCGLKVKLLDGVAVKLEGNPYSPWTLVPSLPYKTGLADAAKIDGALCPKGQAGLQTLYDPYRIRKVLKRVGPRGSGKWQSIPFDQAVKEIVEGGRLFAHVAGEQNRVVPGLKESYALRDPKLAAEMGKAVEEIRAKKMTVEDFKKKFAGDLDKLIDPDHPDFGPKNNQVVFLWGRLKAGRGDFIKRFISDSFGSVNAHGHTTVCQGSLYFTGKAMSDQFVEGKFTKGEKFYWQADTAHVDYLLAIGTAYIEGGYGPTHHAKKMMRRLAEGRLKLTVVDPRFSKIASKAHRWIPIKPGTEAAFVLALIRWIIENKKFDEKFLAAANKAAAAAAGEQSWTNAAWLVKADGTFLRGSDIGLAKEKRTGEAGKEWEFDPFVVLKDARPVAFDPNDEKTAVTGELLVDTTIEGKPVKSVLQLIYESAASKTIAEWGAICDVPEKTLVEIAQEFSSHGKRAVCDPHRGVSQHTNGFYNVLAAYTLNALVGNWDWKGGLIKAATYSVAGEKEGQPFDLGKMHPAKIKPFGLSIIRHDAKYEQSTIFAGYPAKRNWYPFASDVYEEVLPSMADKYPYPCKALISYMAAAPYALPGGQTNIAALTDLDAIPLYIASDITIGEMSMYADYIFPDLSYLERWEFHGSHPSIPQKVQPVRNPVVAPIPENCTVFGEEMPICLESMLMAFAEQLKLPGFGPGGLGAGVDFTRMEDFYLRMVANIAAGDKPGDEVPDASADEIALFERARRHLPKTVFDAARWKAIVGEKWWPKVVYVMNRGGRFQDYEKAFEGEKFKNKYGKLINLYLEKCAKTKSAITGKPFPALATYLPIADVTGKPIADEADGFDLTLITFRNVLHTKSRTVVDYWLLQIEPENRLLLNPADAKRLKLADGALVRVVSKTNPEGIWDLRNGTKKPMLGKVQVTDGIRPGVTGFWLGMGHWANGSADMEIDGELIKGDPRRARGIHANAAMRLDDHLKNTCLLDPVGGSVSFYDTKVKVIAA
jgi:tetrathionate reductase subunit A